MRYAEHGFTATVATWRGVRFCGLTFIRASADDAMACVRQVPKPVLAGITQSPLEREVEGDGLERTSKTPSLPGSAEGEGVPRARVSKVGLAP